MWKNLPIFVVSFFLSDGYKTMESKSFLNTSSKIWLIWKSCEYDKKELCSQKILNLSISMWLHHLLSPKDIRKHNFSPASALLCCQKCALVVTRTHLFHPCPISRNFMRSLFFYNHFIFYEVTILLMCIRLELFENFIQLSLRRLRFWIFW